MEPSKGPVRIAGCSGSGLDRRHALTDLAKHSPSDPIDVIIGDWMSEADMTTRGASKSADSSEPAYAQSFLEALDPALPYLAEHNIKVVVNAGASDTEKLHSTVEKLVSRRKYTLKVAWISGDEVLPILKEALNSNKSDFINIHTGEKLATWKYKPIAAQAYLGGFGIAAALAAGADIVICGRVSDASLTVGAATWWHGWDRTQLDYLANALVAGHLIECSTYITGGNYSGFKSIETKSWENLGFPIAEISRNGHVILTKSTNSGGEVSIGTCTSQLLYEIQGPWYFNSDVTAILDSISFSHLESDRVALHGVKSSPPPPTTKVGITANGGYQAELHFFLVGLDIRPKASMMESQIRRLLAPHMHRFSLLAFTLNGSCPENPMNQNAATVDFRVLAQAPRAEDLAPQYFLRPCLDNIMQGYPGATPHLDLRMAFPKPIHEYFVTTIPQSWIKHKVHTPFSTKQKTRVVQPPTLDQTRTYPSRPPSLDATTAPINATLRAQGGLTDAAGGWAELPAQKGRSILRETFGIWGRTVRGPLGWIVHARSGDKGSDCNVGLWVRHESEYDWLRTLLSVRKVQELLGEEWSRTARFDAQTGKYEGKKIERCEFPGLRAVHFLLRDHLDRGVSCTSSYDFLGKNVAEFIRSRWVDLPVKFLERGRL